MIRTLSVLTGAALLAAMPAIAAERVSIQVSYDAELLSTEAGAAEVYEQIQDAAETACESTTLNDHIREMLISSACEARAVESAVAGIASPKLNAVHERATG